MSVTAGYHSNEGAYIKILNRGKGDVRSRAFALRTAAPLFPLGITSLYIVQKVLHQYTRHKRRLRGSGYSGVIGTLYGYQHVYRWSGTVRRAIVQALDHETRCSNPR